MLNDIVNSLLFLPFHHNSYSRFSYDHKILCELVRISFQEPMQSSNCFHGLLIRKT